MNKGTALTVAFGLLIAGGLFLTSGIRNRSLEEILKGETSKVESAQAATVGGGNTPAGAPTVGGSNATYSNVSGAGAPVAGGTPEQKSILSSLARDFGWGNEKQQWEDIIEKESGWSTTATNPTSGAFGIGQFLGGTKTEYSKYGSESKTSKGQLTAMGFYIRKRYGTPTAALAFHNAHGWY